MGLCQSNIVTQPYGAGILFTNGTHILCGYQPNKKKAIISGFGGKIKENETLNITAIRETLEELFDINPSSDLLLDLENILKTRYSSFNKNYYIMKLSFSDIFKIIKILALRDYVSPLYDIWPNNIRELLFNRKNIHTNEISHLCILPYKPNLVIDQYFIDDINLFMSS